MTVNVLNLFNRLANFKLTLSMLVLGLKNDFTFPKIVFYCSISRPVSNHYINKHKTIVIYDIDFMIGGAIGSGHPQKMQDFYNFKIKSLASF